MRNCAQNWLTRAAPQKLRTKEVSKGDKKDRLVDSHDQYTICRRRVFSRNLDEKAGRDAQTPKKIPSGVLRNVQIPLAT